MDQKIALISGTTSGLGEAMAETLLMEDYHVLGFSRSDATLEHDSYTHFKLDITNEEQVKKAFDQLDQDYGIDLLVNNAGVCDFSPIEEMSSKDFFNILNINVLGQFHMLKHFEPFLIQGETQIINILSIAAKYSFENSAAYTASKYAFKGLVETCQKEWSKHQVKFSSFYPGAIGTPLWDNLDLGNDQGKMLSIQDFLYVFKMCVHAPANLNFNDITFMHKNGFIE